jgi:hypothetical protein
MALSYKDYLQKAFSESCNQELIESLDSLSLQELPPSSPEEALKYLLQLEISRRSKSDDQNKNGAPSWEKDGANLKITIGGTTGTVRPQEDNKYIWEIERLYYGVRDNLDDAKSALVHCIERGFSNN